MEQIESLLKRPLRYDNIDGTLELGLGAMGMGFFALIWMQGHSSRNSIWHSMWMLFVYVGLMGVVLYFGPKAIKNRITYRRTGFVAHRKANEVWAFVIAFVIAAIGLAAIPALSRTPAGKATLPLLVAGLAFVGLYAYRVAFAVRWKWIVAGAMVIAAVVIAFLPPAALASIAGSAIPAGLAVTAGAFLLVSFLWSAMWLVSGGISLSLYCHTTSRSYVENE